MLACDTTGRAPVYVLYVDTSASEEKLTAAAGLVESGLLGNFHYRHARSLGQLGGVRAFAAEDAHASRVAACLAPGQRLGDVKPALLDHRDGWTQVFRGRFVEPRRDYRSTA